MILPPLHGNLEQSGMFIYAACDHDYFTEFGPALINSIKQNSKFGVHLHLYNPDPEQIKYCRSQDRVSITFESAPLDIFAVATKRWSVEPTNAELNVKYKRIINAMGKGNDQSIQHRIQKTYFACARFIRLHQIIQPTTTVLAIDIDAIVRNYIPILSNEYDFYVHHIDGKRARYLAGGIYLPSSNNGYAFLKEYATVLKNNIENDMLHWGIDQDILDTIIPKYRCGQLPMEYIDWNMQPNSCIWTAKGTRKELAVFVNERQKYTV